MSITSEADRSDVYRRIFDVLNRGFGGYNSTWYVLYISHDMAEQQGPPVDGPHFRKDGGCRSRTRSQTRDCLARCLNFVIMV